MLLSVGIGVSVTLLVLIIRIEIKRVLRDVYTDGWNAGYKTAVKQQEKEKD